MRCKIVHQIWRSTAFSLSFSLSLPTSLLPLSLSLSLSAHFPLSFSTYFTIWFFQFHVQNNGLFPTIEIHQFHILLLALFFFGAWQTMPNLPRPCTPAIARLQRAQNIVINCNKILNKQHKINVEQQKARIVPTVASEFFVERTVCTTS